MNCKILLRFELLLHFEKLVCFICLISDTGMLSYTKFYPFNTRLYRFCFQLILHSPFSLDFSFIIAAVFLCFFIALTVLNYLF